MNKQRVLILCTGNSARSKVAEGLLRHDAGDRFEVCSAGMNPSRVRSEAIAVMQELGIDLSGHRSKHVNEFSGQKFDYVLTVCDNARESCPIFPGATAVIQKASKIQRRPSARKQNGCRSFDRCETRSASTCEPSRKPTISER